VVAKELMQKIVTGDDELITVYFGSDVTQEAAQQLTEELADLFRDCDVEMHRGGQPLYYYLISVE
ncbi:MAG: DAK2 domain-containing protein, partial [Firmicutes bacterium]|nr:DAK2 domain-containing protein [Bacillota bacterium]